MADVLKSSKTGAPSRRGVDRVALQATLADLARAAGDATGSDGSPSEATPGPAGHQALAALAAEVAQASALAEAEPDTRPATDVAPAPSPRVSPIAAALRTSPSRRAAAPSPAAPPPAASPANAAGQGPAPIGALRPIGQARSVQTAPVDASTAGETAGLPAPNRLVPGSVRLPTKPAESAMAPDQPTIPLRRRAISGGPVSISPTPPTQAVETGSVGNGQTGPAAAASPAVRGASPSVVAWLPSDDDILPRRQLRRGRSFRRAR